MIANCLRSILLCITLLTAGCNGQHTDHPIGALISAIKHEDVKLVKNALEQMDNNTMNQVDTSGSSPLLLALETKDSKKRNEIVAMLLEAGANPNVKEANTVPVLSRAVMLNDPSLLKILLDKKAQVDIEDWDGATPLMYAAFSNARKVVPLLLQAHANVNKMDKRHQYPMDYALSVGDAQMSDLLRKQGGKSALDSIKNAKEAQDLMKLTGIEDTVTYFFLQIDENNLFAVRLMLMAGYHVNKQTDEKLTELAKSGKTYQMLKLLLHAGGDPNQQEAESGSTPLIAAIHAKQANSVTLLLENGADVKRKDSHGKTALEYAIDKPEIRALLLGKETGMRP